MNKSEPEKGDGKRTTVSKCTANAGLRHSPHSYPQKTRLKTSARTGTDWGVGMRNIQGQDEDPGAGRRLGSGLGYQP